MARATTACIVALFATVSAARADWQYTRWGMTVDEVLASSNGQMKTCDIACSNQKTDAETARLYAEYRSGDFEFIAFAFFDNRTQKLASMQLRLEDPLRGEQMIGALTAKYGEPAARRRYQAGTIDLTTWRSDTDQIEVLRIGFRDSQSYTLRYRPRLTNSNKGL